MPVKNKRIKRNSQEWFDNEISEKLTVQDKGFRKYSKTRQKKLKTNLKSVSVNWKTYGKLLNHSDYLGCIIDARAENQIVEHDTKSILETFKSFYSNLARNLLAKLLKLPNWYTIICHYYKKLSLSENWKLESGTEGWLFNMLKNVEVRKAAGIDQISGKYLKDGVWVLVKPISKLCSLSMTLRSFLGKVHPLCKKCSKIDPSTYRPIPLLPLLSKFFERVILDQTEVLVRSYMTINPVLGKTTQQIHVFFFWVTKF